MYTYTPFYGPDSKLQSVQRSDGASIPINPDNSDYAAFLKTNTPFLLTGTPTIAIAIPKPHATLLADIQKLSSLQIQGLTLDIVTRVLLANPDIAAKYNLTVTL